MAVPAPEGARPVFAEGKDRQRWAFLFWAHFSLGGKKAESIKFPLFRRGGFHIRPSSNFDLSVRLVRATSGRPYEEESETNKIGTVKMLPQNP